MGDETNGVIQIEATPQTRAGVFSDMATASTRDGVTRLDFIHADAAGDEPGDAAGVLSARVFMSNEALLRLRDMLERHTAGWKVMEEAIDAE